MARIGDWAETHTGGRFYPLDPRPEEVSIEDIAHSLSLLCRFGGHCNHFYSVAQHSLNVAAQMRRDGVSPLVQSYGLLHDAAEAYVCDVPRPLKQSLPGYREIEAKVQRVIWQALGLPEPGEAQALLVKVYDDWILAAEARGLMRRAAEWHVEVNDTVKADCRYMKPTRARGRFIREFERLRGEAKMVSAHGNEIGR